MPGTRPGMTNERPILGGLSNGGPHPGRSQELQAARPRFVRRLGRRLDRRNQQGLRLCRRGRLGELQRAGGLHCPRRARSAQSEEGRRGEVAARRAFAQAPRRRRRHSLCELRAARRRGRPQRPHRPVHLRHLQGRRAEADRLLRPARHRAAPLRRRQQAQARDAAEQRARLERPRDLDARHQGPDQARGPQPVGPALDEGTRATATSARPHRTKRRSPCTARRRSAATACIARGGAAASR